MDWLQVISRTACPFYAAAQVLESSGELYLVGTHERAFLLLLPYSGTSSIGGQAGPILLLFQKQMKTFLARQSFP